MGVHDRRRQIVDLVRSYGRVDVQQLTERFGVNAETIRRDLTALDEAGTLQRVHGGAVARGPMAVENRMSARVSELHPEKMAIARAAAAEIPPFGAVFIEAGSTTACLAGLVPDRSDLVIVTNGLQIAYQLAELGASTVMTLGGRVRPLSFAEVDAWALQRLERLRFDVAFVGTNAVDAEWGLSTPDPAEAAVKEAILASAQRSVLMVDNTKFGMTAACRYGSIDDIDVVVTDAGTDDAIIDELVSAGTDVRRADVPSGISVITSS